MSVRSFPWEDKARVELNDIPELRLARLEDFRSRLLELKSDEFKPITEGKFLMVILRGRKFDVDRAVKTYMAMCDARIAQPKFMFPIGKGPLDYRLIYELPVVTVCPQRNPKDGTTVMFLHYKHFDQNVLDMRDLDMAQLLLILMLQQDPSVQTHGFRFVYDMKYYRTSYLFTTGSLAYIKALTRAHQEAFTVRIKGFHVLHNNPVLETAINVFRPLMSKKIGERLHFHGSNMESLHEYIDPAILPEEAGGKLGDAKMGNFERELLSRNDEYVALSHTGYLNV